MPKPVRDARAREKGYRVRAVHRTTPDVHRLTELVIRLAIQRREIDRAALVEPALSIPGPGR